MRRLPISLMLVAILGIATLGGFAVAQDTPATPQVVQPGTPEILPELCPTTEAMGTPVDLTAGTPAGGEATPALFQCATPGASPAATTGQAASDPVTIDAVDIAWNPSQVTIPANTDVTVRVPNVGLLPHTFVIEELGIKLEMAAGQTQEVVINAPAGTYDFICDVPGHAQVGMVGTLTVQ